MCRSQMHIWDRQKGNLKRVQAGCGPINWCSLRWWVCLWPVHKQGCGENVLVSAPHVPRPKPRGRCYASSAWLCKRNISECHFSHGQWPQPDLGLTRWTAERVDGGGGSCWQGLIGHSSLPVLSTEQRCRGAELSDLLWVRVLGRGCCWEGKGGHSQHCCAQPKAGRVRSKVIQLGPE